MKGRINNIKIILIDICLTNTFIKLICKKAQVIEIPVYQIIAVVNYSSCQKVFPNI